MRLGDVRKGYGLSAMSAVMLFLACNVETAQPRSEGLIDGTGIYRDGWVGPEVALSLRNPEHEQGLKIYGENVQTGLEDESQTIHVYFPGGKTDSVTIETPGEFEVFLGIPPQDATLDTLDLRILASKTFVPAISGTSHDDRVLGFRLNLIAMVDEETLARQLPDNYDFPSSTPSRYVTGVFADGWISDRAVIVLHRRDAAKTIEIRGYIPPGMPDRWLLAANGHVLTEGRPPRQSSGVFTARIELPDSIRDAKRIRLEIVPGGTYVPAERGLNEDQRSLSYKLVHVRMAH
jgi:hypothetical protein